MIILNNREAKKILHDIEEHWGCKLGEILADFSMVITEKKKVYLLSRDFTNFKISAKINSAGVYFANVRDNKLRLTIEGSEIVGPKATKNIVDINKVEAEDWIRGKNILGECDVKGYVIIRHKHELGVDYMGCGHYKDDVVTNFVPKTRRIHAE